MIIGWVVFCYLSVGIYLTITIQLGFYQEMFNVLVESIKTSTEVHKQAAQSNQELVKNCSKMIECATRMLNVAVDKLDASGSKKAAGAYGSNKTAGASGSKKAAGAQRGKRKVIVTLDGEEKEVGEIYFL